MVVYLQAWHGSGEGVLFSRTPAFPAGEIFDTSLSCSTEYIEIAKVAHPKQELKTNRGEPILRPRAICSALQKGLSN